MYNAVSFTFKPVSSNNENNNDGDDKEDTVHFVDRFSSVPVELDENENNLYTAPQLRRRSVICTLRWVILSICYALNWVWTLIAHTCHWCVQAISRARRSRNVAVDRNTMLLALNAQHDETSEKTSSVVDVDSNAFVSNSQDNQAKEVGIANKTNRAETTGKNNLYGSNTGSSTHTFTSTELATHFNGNISALPNRAICEGNQTDVSLSIVNSPDKVKVATHVIDMDALFGQIDNETTESKAITNEIERKELKSSCADNRNSNKSNISTSSVNAQSLPLISLSLIRELQSHRKPLQHMDELTTFVQQWNQYLPITLHVSIANHNDNACNNEQHRPKTVAQLSAVDSATDDVYNNTHTIEKEKCAMLPVSFMLHVMGPIRASRTADILSIVEDVLLEDCDANYLKLTAVHCSDLSFTSLETANIANTDGINQLSMINTQNDANNNNSNNNYFEYTKQSQNSSIGVVTSASTNIIEDKTKPINNTLNANVLRSNKEDLHNDKSTTLPTRTKVGEAEMMKLLRDAHRRVRVFVKNVLDSTLDECTSFTMTRCTCDPSDFNDAIPLNLCALEELRFAHCPLSSAHVSSLLQLAISQTMNSLTSHVNHLNRKVKFSSEQYNLHDSSRANTDHHDNSNKATEVRTTAFGKLVYIQLSGAVTTEAVMELLNYFEEELTQHCVLRLLQIPSGLVRAARAHHFLQSHPLVQVKAN